MSGDLMEPINYQYNPNQSVSCRHCNWTGLMKDCKEKRYVSSYESWQHLAGREGWEYFCPKCNWFITALWNKVS